MLYNVVLFLHIIGAISMFTALGITLLAMASMLQAKSVEALRNWAALAVKMDNAMPFCIVLIVAPALFLVMTVWGWKEAWVNVSLATLLGITVMGIAINAPKLREVLDAANAEEPGTPSARLRALTKDRPLWNSVSLMVMLSVGIVFLMTVKAGFAAAVATLAAAAIAGISAAGLILNREAKRAPSNPKGTAL